MDHCDVSPVGARSRGQGVFELAIRWRAALGALRRLSGGHSLFLLLLLASSSYATTYYSYDNLGRVTQATESNGSTTQYTYDANGNITSITRTAGSSVLSIGSLSASSGATGSSVTINGSGFSSIPSQNTVTLNGVAAQVIYASDNRIVIVVPAGAATGNIGITTQNGSITSSSPFTVIPVSVTSFSPSSGTVATVVTVNGGGFNPTPSNNTVLINGVAATVSTATPTQLTIVVPSGATPGHISVTTSLGTGVSAADFFVPAPGYTLGQIPRVAALIPAGDGQVYAISAANQVAVALFDGISGQRMTVATKNQGVYGHYTVFAPDGSTFANDIINTNTTGTPVNLQPLPMAGTYALYYTASSIPASVTFALQTDVVGGLPIDGTPTATSLAPGQSATYTFSGTAGQSYSLTLTPFTGTDIVSTSIFNPNGSFLQSCGNFQAYYNSLEQCDFTVTTTGTYTLRLVPSGSGLYAYSFNTFVVQDFTATLTAGTPGPTVGVSLVPNQHGLLSFTAAANQTLALYFGTASITPSNDSLQLKVTGPGNASLPGGSVGNGQSTTLNFPNLAAGTYSVLAYPFNTGAAVSLQAALANGVTATLPVNGTSSQVQTYVPGQVAYFTFAATAGQNLGLGLTQLDLTPGTVGNANISIYKPDTGYLTSGTCYLGSTPGCQISLRNLPQTGNYQVVVTPGGEATMSLAMTISQDVGGTLALGTPANVTLSYAGQNASLSFSANGSQPIVLNLGSISTTPANTPLIVYVYDSSGNLVTQSSLTLSGIVNLGALPAGTYSVLIAPNNAATGTVQITLGQGITGTIATDGTPSGTLSLPNGQAAYLSFTGTAGTDYSIALTNLTATNSGSVGIGLRKPDGTPFTITYNCVPFTASSGNCDTGPLPVSGTYTIVLTPSAGSTASFNAVLSPDRSGGTLAINAAPTLLNETIPAQNVWYTFSGTAGQKVTFVYTGNTLARGTLYLVNPDGSVLGSGVEYAGSSGGTIDATLPTTATYTVYVYVEGVSTGQMSVGVVSDATGALTSGGTYSTAISLVSGENASYTFNGVAGQEYSLALTGLTTVPAGGSVNATILNPGGTTTLVNCNSYSPTSGNCDFTTPSAGSYTLRLDPSGTVSSSFNVVLSPDLTGSLALNAAPVLFSASTPGQNIRYSLAGSAGQKVTLAYTGNTIGRGTLYILNPNGSVLTNSGNYGGSASGYLDTTLPTTGTYTVIVYVDGSSTGSLNITAMADVLGAVSPDGTPQSIALLGAQKADFTFAGSAGATYSLALTNLTTSPAGATVNFSITTPTGGSYSTAYNCTGFTATTGNCDLSALPATGTYTVRFVPYNSASASFNVVLSQAFNGGSLTPGGAAQTFTTTVPGQNSIYTFSGTAGQTLSLVYSSNNIPVGTLYVWSPTGAAIANTNYGGIAGGTVTIPALPSTGTYAVTVFVDGVSTGHVTVQLLSR